MSRLLRATTALTSVLGVMALESTPAAQAQTIGPSQVPYAIISAGADQGTGTDNGGGGAAGGTPTDLTVIVPQTIVLGFASDTPILLLSTKGGNGGDGGSNASSESGNGGNAGSGGYGGGQSLFIDVDTVINNIGKGMAISMASQGGTGGTGGDAGHYAIGGEGAAGGNGGILQLTTSSTYDPATATPTNIYNGGQAQTAIPLIQLQSLGGDGGDGGDGTLAQGTDTGVGRQGQAGGDGGNIIVALSPSHLGAGLGSAVTALSAGGQGGDGSTGSSQFGKGKGGAGGNGGSGGNVVISLNTGLTLAEGALAPGVGNQIILDAYVGGVWTQVNGTTAPLVVALSAQSIGGGSGNGGGDNGNAGEGGAGGAAGAGGNTQILLNGGIIRTYYYSAVGVLALSAGGAGGDGASGSGVYNRHGGSGGPGGNGGIASIRLGASAPGYTLLQTNGADSDALIAMSIGGGGGYGGDVIGGGAGVTISVGGAGGNGGIGGNVAVSNGYWVEPTDGSAAYFVAPYVVNTTGDFSRGVVAASIGGGGGRGGDASGINLGPVSVTIGGSGGSGAVGGSVEVDNFGIIQTAGAHSTGVFAQSVGGGGGTGGAAISTDVGSIVTVAVAVGGSGGTGGVAGAVTVNNFKQIGTTGSDAFGVMAQSVGGGGGHGGSSLAQTFALNPPDEPSLTLTASIGGKGGKGGDGGIVSLLNAGMITTQGQGASGAFAQSVGGGGGTGGDSTATSSAYTQSKLTISTSIGGSGGAGGAGGAVTAYNSGLIRTLHDMAPALIAQSVGGGGGAGGFGTANTGSFNAAGNYSMELTVAVGGRGGAGGVGGDVTVYNYVSAANTPDTGTGSPSAVGGGGILTAGDASDGIFAQSIGGGGGIGGNATGSGSNGQITINIAVGGGGGGGGNGGAVIVDNGTSVIITSGASAAGVFAQSVGGGGGRGGSATTGSGNDPQYAFASYLGGQMATDLGLGSNPAVNAAGTGANTIWDWKDNIQGAYSDYNRLKELQDGYNRLNNGDPSTKESSPSATDFTVDIGGGYGGAGGSGGNGGTVTLTNAGFIGTTGPQSAGMIGQSIGGSGGIGGAANPSTSNDKLSSALVTGAIGVGGGGGSAGNGGSVNINNTGTISTTGDLAQGIMAQSIGGGGGVGGLTVSTSGVGFNLNMSLGGTDGASGAGGAASVTNVGLITTTGDEAPGILAQSIGGGGGITALLGAEYNSQNGKSASSVAAIRAIGSGANLTMNLPGSSGDGSDGGAVLVTLLSGGKINTSGINSYGIIAQSVGGGGGLMIGGQSDTGSSNIFQHDSRAKLPVSGGAATVDTWAGTSITTSGAGAIGILAQSVGGGGGIINGMDSVDLSRPVADSPGSRQQGGQAANVVVRNSADITTTGVNATGIFAQAVGGGGGVIGRIGGPLGYLFGSPLKFEVCGSNEGATPCSGSVFVDLNSGTITVSGAGSYGVFINSQGNGQNNGTLSMNGGRIITLGNARAAVLMNVLGSHNVVNNGGEIDASGSLSGMAIATAGGAASIQNNRGIISGSVDVGAGSTFNNGTAAAFNTGPLVNLGAGGQLINAGTVNIGGSGKIAITALTGDYLQGSGGRMVIDTDLVTGKSDLIVITGKADIAGTVHVQPTSISNKTLTVLTATQGVTLQPSLVSTNTTQLFAFTPKVSGNTLQIQTKANFTAGAASLGNNQRAVAANLQSVFDTGGSMDAGFNALNKVNGAANYARSLRTLSGQTLGALAAFRFNSSHSFVANMYSGCASYDRSGALSDEVSCAWSRMVGSTTKQDSSADALGYDASAVAFQLGGQHEIANNWYLSGSLAYETSQFDGDENSSKITGDSILGGAYLRYHKGPLQASAAVDAGYGWYVSKRFVSVGDVSGTAKAKPQEWHAGLHARLAYELPLGKTAYLKPFVDGHAVYVRGRAYAENGLATFNLAVEAQGNTALAGAAGVEIGARVKLAGSTYVRPFVSTAYEVLNNNDWSTTARFVGQPAPSPGFRASTPAPDRLGKFALGLDILAARNADLSFAYTPEVGSGYLSHAGVAKLAYRF